jgi:glycosyltransferase involved in cell wall biosynthesis
MKPKASIIISSYNRLALLRRTLWAIATRPPSVPFEVILVDDGSTEDIIGELKLYSAKFPWKFVPFDRAAFESFTGLKKLHNNPCVTNNVAFRHAEGDLIFQQGNEVVAYGDVYDRLIKDVPAECPHYWMVFSTTYDVPKEVLNALDPYGSNLGANHVAYCERWPLQSQTYPSDVTNYISLAPRALWDALNGYDERYYAGISAEDSDFVRRARTIPGFKTVVSDGISLHQYHAGKTCYYDPPPSVISREQWDEGVAINHAVYNAWDKTHLNRQRWPWGTLGVGEVITPASLLSGCAAKGEKR